MLLVLLNLFTLIYGIHLLFLLRVMAIIFILLMSFLSSHRSIFLKTKQQLTKLLLNSKLKLSYKLILRLKFFNLIGVGNFKGCHLFLSPLALFITLHILTHHNKMAILRENIDIL